MRLRRIDWSSLDSAGRREALQRPAVTQNSGLEQKVRNIIATVRQDWPTIATTLTDIIDAHFAGTDPTEPIVYVPAILITKDNAKAGS